MTSSGVYRFLGMTVTSLLRSSLTFVLDQIGQGRSPVDVTSARPFPETATVPKNTILWRSPNGRSGCGIDSVDLATGVDSPVNEASCVWRLVV